MSIENAVKNRVVLLEQVGKAGLNLRYPKEFEVYTIALELIDVNGKTLRYFIFPVNPSSLDELENSITSIKKTATGIVALSNSTFVPIPINLSGTFGRRFRVLLGGDFLEVISSFRNSADPIVGIESGLQDFFDNRVKTGFGCLNILKEILADSDTVDEKGPRTLILHNLPFGNSYIVKVNSVKTSMTQDTNMLHQYAVSLTAIAPLDAVRGNDLTEERTRTSVTGRIQSQTDRLIRGVSNILR